GFVSMYDGLTAQLMRQMTYTTMRFHLYSVGKQYVNEHEFSHKIFVATIAGVLAGIVAVPFEVINARMQIDRTLSGKLRRNYRHVFHGLYRVIRIEGWKALYKGGFYSCMRAVLITIGQNATYDQAKMMLLKFSFDKNSKKLHLLSSLIASLISAPLLQPIDILKTVQMTSHVGHLETTHDKFKYIMRFGVRGLFRGLGPSLCRLVPSTIIVLFMYEQLRLKFGYYADQ
ncbi:CG6893, partial [Drosophila busckii]